jgi:hypothetical protein
MNYRDFLFWLQGFIELTAKDHIFNHPQVEIIKSHIRLARQTKEWEEVEEVATTEYISGILDGGDLWRDHNNPNSKRSMGFIHVALGKFFHKVTPDIDPSASQAVVAEVQWDGTGQSLLPTWGQQGSTVFNGSCSIDVGGKDLKISYPGSSCSLKEQEGSDEIEPTPHIARPIGFDVPTYCAHDSFTRQGTFPTMGTSSVWIRDPEEL